MSEDSSDKFTFSIEGKEYVINEKSNSRGPKKNTIHGPSIIIGVAITAICVIGIFFSLNVNKDVWAGLPGEVKNALKAAVPAWQKDSIDRVNNGAAAGLARCKKDFGTVYTRMSDADIKAWAAMLPPLAKNWAAAQDKKGLPGTAILKAWMDNMRANNQPVMRDWDVK